MRAYDFDYFDSRHDRALDIELTEKALNALAAIEADEIDELKPSCDHPIDARVEIDADEGIEFCGACETERQAGRWLA